MAFAKLIILRSARSARLEGRLDLMLGALGRRAGALASLLALVVAW